MQGSTKKNLDLEKKFNEAEKVSDEKGMEACREGYQELLQEVRADGEDFSSMMRLYNEMKQRGNKLLDVSGSYTEPERIIQMFKEFGVKEFHLLLQLDQRQGHRLGLHENGLQPERYG